MTSPSSLCFVHLTKRYHQRSGPDVEADSDISFEVAPGEYFGLLAPNGSGKTTTIKYISGFYPPTEGEGCIANFDVFVHLKLEHAATSIL